MCDDGVVMVMGGDGDGVMVWDLLLSTSGSIIFATSIRSQLIASVSIFESDAYLRVAWR